LKKREEQLLPGSEGMGKVKGREQGQEGEMVQTMYAHMINE
jgi:hypothetical protein